MRDNKPHYVILNKTCNIQRFLEKLFAFGIVKYTI